MPASPIDRRLAGGHIPVLDGIRGLAIVMVLFVHFVGDQIPHDALGRAAVKLSNYGIWGVDLFFVLSGFLITGILWDAKGAPRYFRTFYARRTLRIFPLYYAVLFCAFALAPALGVHDPALAESARHQSWLWTYTSNVYLSLTRGWTLPYLGHFWSLSVEEHFYLVWPMVVFHSSARQLLRISAGAFVFSLALRWALSFGGAGELAVLVLTPCRFDALCAGAFLAISARTLGLREVAARARRALVPLTTAILVVSLWHAATGLLADFTLPLRGSLLALFFGSVLVVAIAAEPASMLSRVFGGRVLRFFGKYSYGLYVFHGLVAYALQERRTEDLLADALGSARLAMATQAIAGMAFSVLVAVASYELFEKQFLRLKDRFSGRVGSAVAISVRGGPSS